MADGWKNNQLCARDRPGEVALVFGENELLMIAIDNHSVGNGESIWRGEILLYSASRRGATWARTGDELAFELTPLVFMLAPNA